MKKTSTYVITWHDCTTSTEVANGANSCVLGYCHLSYIMKGGGRRIIQGNTGEHEIRMFENLWHSPFNKSLPYYQKQTRIRLSGVKLLVVCPDSWKITLNQLSIPQTTCKLGCAHYKLSNYHYEYLYYQITITKIL